MNVSDFRKELLKLMPGYKWTVHKSRIPERYLTATGIISSGLNRTSTLEVTKNTTELGVDYEVKFAGNGTKSPWVFTTNYPTLARAFRELQKSMENKASIYSHYSNTLQNSRDLKDESKNSN